MADQSSNPPHTLHHQWSWPRFFRNAVLITLAITGGVVLYVKQIKPSIVPRNFGVIVEGELYRSGRPTPAALRRLVETRELGMVIDLGTFPIGTPEQRRLEGACRVLGIEYHRLPLIGDGTGDPNLYARALRLMTAPGHRPTLVHCGSGAQRTSGVVTLYRHLVEGVQLDEAYRESEGFWHDPEDNPNLKPMLDQWVAQIGRVYREGGLIDYQGPARERDGRVTQPLPPLPPMNQNTTRAGDEP